MHDDSTASLPFENDNEFQLSRAQLCLPLGEIFHQVKLRSQRQGPVRAYYEDEFDRFTVRLERSNLGFSVGVFLNGLPAYQLNGRFFDGSKPVGDVLVIASGAEGAEMDEFFK